MDLGWNRVPILLILLTFWKHAAGHKGWSSQEWNSGTLSEQKGPVHKVFSPRGAQSSVLEAPVTGSIPFEEVASNVFAGKSLNANGSLFSLSHQYVKGGGSSSYDSMSHTQSAPSASVSASVVLPQNPHASDGIEVAAVMQGSFSPSVQDIANQTGYQLVTSSPLSATSNTSTGSSAISLSKFTYTSLGSSRPHKAGSSSQLVSTHGSSGLLQSLPSNTASQNIPWSSAFSKLAASPLGVGQSTSGQSSYSQYTSGSQSRAGTQLAASRQYVPTSFQPEAGSMLSLGAKVPASSQYYPATQSGSSLSQGFQTSGAPQGISQSHSRLFSLSSASTDPASTFQLQGTSSQYAPAALDSKVPVQSSLLSQGSKAPSRYSTQYSPAYAKYGSSFIDSTSQATSDQSSFDLHASSSQSRVGTQLAGSSLVPTQTGSTSTAGSSLQLQGTSSQHTPAALTAKVPVYNQAPSGSFSLSQPSQLKPSISSWSQGFQASSTVTSQSSSPSQGSKAPSRFSAIISASPGQFASTQTGSTFTDGSSLQLQGTSSQYTPAALVAKMPVYNQAALSSSSLSLSQPSQLKPSTSRWSQGFQTSGTVSQGFQTPSTVTSQSSSQSQGSKAPSRFSTLISAASPGQFASPQEGGGRYSGLSSQFQSASSQYSPGSPAYAKYGSSLLDVSQSTSYQSRTGTQLTGSSRYVPTQTGNAFTDGSPLQLQGTSSQYAPALAAKVPVSSQAAPSGYSSSQPSQWQPSTSRLSQGFQVSGTVASQSSSSQGSKAPSRLSTLTSSPGQFAPTQTGSTLTDGSSFLYQGPSSQYTPAAWAAKVPVYNRAPPSGSSSSLSQPSQLNPSSWSQGFQASGTASQSGSSQGSKVPSRFSTLTSAASPGQFASPQSASSQYRPGSPAYVKHGTSLLDVSSQSTGDRSASALYASSSQSRTDTPLAGSRHYVPTQTGSTLTDGSSLQLQGTSRLYAPVAVVAKVPVYSPVTPSGSLLSQSLPSASSWSQGFQASGTAVSQSSSSLQTPQLSSGSVMSTLSPPMDSVAQSSSSVIHRQMSPGLLSSVQYPIGSVTSGSNVQAASQGTFSGQSSDSTAVISSSYSSHDQKPLGYSRPSQSSSASRRYSSVKG